MSAHSAQDALTHREAQALVLLAGGLNQAAVADLMGISRQTLKNHMTAVYRKLGATTLLHAMNRLGWVRVPIDWRGGPPHAAVSRVRPRSCRPPRHVGLRRP